MKQAVGAAVALAFGLGLMASAQAAGVHRQSAAPNMQNGSTQQMQQSRINPQRLQKVQRLTSKQSVRQLQKKLRAEGFYKGRVDGIVGPKTRHAMARAEQATGAPRTAKMHQRGKQTNQEIGVGASAPNGNFNQPMMPQTNPTPNNQNLNYNQTPSTTQPQNQ